MDPVTLFTIGSAALNVGKTLFGYNKQKKAAQENTRLANMAAQLEQRQLMARQNQELMAMRQVGEQTMRQGAAAAGVQQVSAATADTMGTSVDQAALQIEQSVLNALQTNGMNIDNLNTQFDDERLGIRARQKNRIASVPKPSALGAGLDIAGSLLGLKSDLGRISSARAAAGVSGTTLGPAPLPSRTFSIADTTRVAPLLPQINAPRMGRQINPFLPR